METPLGVAGARARNSVGSSDWQALCELEAELEAELRDEVTRSSERSRRKRAEGNGTSWDSPGVSSGPPTRARASTERPTSSCSSPTASSSPGYRLRRQPHPSWAPSASQTPASASSPGADRSPRASRWSTELGVVLDGFGRPMLPLDTSASFARPGRAPLRERETKTWAETTPAVASAVPAARRERLDANENGDTGDDVGGPAVDDRAGAHRVRGGFVDDARSLSAARPVRPRALAGSVSQERQERRERRSRDTRRAARPPFVVGAGDSNRARFLKASAARGPRKENRSSSSIGGKSVFARSSEIPDATPRKASHTHASPAGIAGRAAGEGAFSVAPDPGNRASPRREDPPPRAEGGANGDVFAAAVDATRSLFDAVERRVRDAVAREIETRHRLGGAQAVASPGSEPSPVPRPTPPSAASPPSSLEPAKDARGSAASVDDVSEALASASPLSGLSGDGKTPIRAVKRSIDAYLERRRSGSAAAASTRLSPVVPRRSDDAPPRREKTEPSFATMTAKQRSLEPPKLVIRDVTDSNPSHGFESETFLERSDPEPFTYAPVYSPAAARDATASLHSSFKTSSSIASAARAEESPKPSKRRFATGVDSNSIGVDLRARLRAAARVVSPRERDADDARTSPTRFSKNSDSDASDDGDAFTDDAFFKHKRLNVPETSSDSDVSDAYSDSKEDVHVARGGDGLELVSFCRRYRAARVCAVVLERWMYQARLRAALAAAHHAHVSRARAFYAWRAERLERAIRVEVALRFATHARKTRARRLLAKTTRAWLRETRRAKAFRVAEVVPTASSESHGDGLAAARARLRPVGLVPRPDSTAAEDDARDARAMAEMGTMTDDVDDVVDVETVPVSLDAFTRVLVDGLVDETVRAHETAEACGPLVSSIPTALATNLFEDDASGIYGFNIHGGERDGSDEDGIERRRPTVASEPRGFSPENAAAVDSVTADAADAVGVAVRGLLGLWKLSDETHVDADGEPSSRRATIASLPTARRRSASKSKSKSPRVTNAFATPKRALRFDPLRDGAASDENVDDDEFAGWTHFDSTGIRSNTSRNTPRSSSASLPRRSRRVVFDRARGTTMLSAGKVRGAEGENVYLSIAEYVDVVNKAAASYV